MLGLPQGIKVLGLLSDDPYKRHGVMLSSSAGEKIMLSPNRCAGVQQYCVLAHFYQHHHELVHTCASAPSNHLLYARTIMSQRWTYKAVHLKL